MTVPGYAKDDVLVSADWAREHLADPTVRFVEVDVDTTAYEQSHLPGAVGWNWTSQLSDGIRRDIATRAEFSELLSSSGIGPDTTIVLYGDNNNWFAAWAYWQLKLFGHPDVRILNGGRKYWLDNGLPLTTDVPTHGPTGYQLPEVDPALRAFRDDILPRLGDAELVLVDVRSPAEFNGEIIAPPGLSRDRPAGRPHPGRGQHPVGPDGPRGRHVQGPRRARGALRGEGRDRRQGRHRLLPDRGAQQPFLVRAPRAPRLRPGPQLRRLVDRVGLDGRRADREARPGHGLSHVQSPLSTRSGRRDPGGADLIRRLAIALIAVGLFAACTAPGTSAPAPAGAGATALRLGYFPNVTHAPALVGLEKGIFAEKLGTGVRLEPATFTAGPAAVEALLSGALDATYIGPNPAINAFAKSNGEAIRIIAGSTSGGAFLVVRDGIESPADLRGKTLATPQLGNTQDVALRTWLADQGYATTLEGGGDVSVTPQDNAQTLETFKAGQIDGGWVPEPWASQAHPRSRRPRPGRRARPLARRPVRHDAPRRPDRVPRSSTPMPSSGCSTHTSRRSSSSTRDPAEAQRLTNLGIERATGKKLKDEILEASWQNLSFTVDPVASSLKGSADHAVAVSLLDPVELKGIYDLNLVNGLLVARGGTEVAGL